MEVKLSNMRSKACMTSQSVRGLNALQQTACQEDPRRNEWMAGYGCKKVGGNKEKKMLSFSIIRVYRAIFFPHMYLNQWVSAYEEVM